MPKQKKRKKRIKEKARMTIERYKKQTKQNKPPLNKKKQKA